MKDFADGIEELLVLVGEGELTGEVVVDQVYAHVQHERLDFHHPRGGHARYLGQPLLDESDHYLQRIADDLLEVGPVPPMIDAVENLAVDQLQEHAPVLFENLRESGHPMVRDQGGTVYDREPIQRRLTDDELDEQRRLADRHRRLHPDQYHLPRRVV